MLERLFPALIGLLLTVLGAGCSSNNLEAVNAELHQGGFQLWYPAEAGIMPGDIIYNGQRVAQKPKGVSVSDPADVVFATLTKTVDVGINASVGISSARMQEAQATLQASGVHDVTDRCAMKFNL